MDTITLALRFVGGQPITKQVKLEELGIRMDLDDEYFFKEYGFYKTDRCSLENYIHDRIDEASMFEVSWRFYHGTT